MRLNFHRLLHRYEHTVDAVTESVEDLKHELSPGHIVHKIQRKAGHFVHHIQHKVDYWLNNFGTDIDISGASWESFAMITSGQFFVTILMAALFVLDMYLGYNNFNNIVGLIA